MLVTAAKFTLALGATLALTSPSAAFAADAGQGFASTAVSIHASGGIGQ